MTASRVEVGGFVAPGFERVAAKFERNFTARQEVGAAFAATLGGRPVVDLWGGLAAPERGEPWREDTAQVMFSGTKGLVAACLVLLMDRGLLSLDDAVADHWPEFAAHGKASVRVRDVVSHAARLPGLATRVTWQEATDDRRMAALLASQPQCEDERAASTYHAITFGWLCGELVRRVDGRSIGTFFAQEIAAPLGLDLWIGVPEHVEHRIARISVGATWSRAPIARARPDSHDRLLASVYGNPVRFDPAGGFPWNEQAWLAAEVPGVNAVGTARSIARLYGELPALLSREGLELACTATDKPRRPAARQADDVRRRLPTPDRGSAVRSATRRLRARGHRWLPTRPLAGGRRRLFVRHERAAARAWRRPRDRTSHGAPRECDSTPRALTALREPYRARRRSWIVDRFRSIEHLGKETDV